MVCQAAPICLYRTERLQQIDGLLPGAGGRWINKVEFRGRVKTPAQQLQGEAGEVGLQDLGGDMRCKLVLLLLGPEAITSAGLQSTSSPGPLGCRSGRDFHGVESAHTGTRIKAGFPGEAGIDDNIHAINSQAGFGNVGGENDLTTLGRWINRCLLFSQGQIAVQGMNADPGFDLVLQTCINLGNLTLSWQENQQVAVRVVA